MCRGWARWVRWSTGVKCLKQPWRMLHAESGLVAACVVQYFTALPTLPSNVRCPCHPPLPPPPPPQTSRLSGLVSRFRVSPHLEVQSRCCEYSRLLEGHAGIAPQLLERMPAIEDPTLSSGGATPAGSSGA